MSYACTVLADSMSPWGHRLLTVEVTFPRFILAEVNTHRDFSRNSASSRAIPPEHIIKRVIEEPFVPAQFNTRVKGMGVGDPLSVEKQAQAESQWLYSRLAAIRFAEELLTLDVDKSRINRLLEPYMWHTAIISSTQWDNFFALRDHPAAQPEFRTLAGLMLDTMRASEPRSFIEGWWHLPLCTEDEIGACVHGTTNWEYMAMVSAGRCARVSFDKQGEYEPIEDSHARAMKLKKSGHLSPMEHPATPLKPDEHGPDWQSRSTVSNFVGWKQLRKTIPDEANLVGTLEGRQRWDA